MQSIENINRDVFRGWRIDNGNGVFYIGVEYIGSDEVIGVIEFGPDSVKKLASDS